MSDLHLLRHAKAVPQGLLPGGAPAEDRDRPLNARGRHAAAAMAAHIAALEPPPDLVLCSPSRRTRETLDGIAPAFRRLPAIAFEEDLYLAGAARLLERLRRLPAEIGCVLLIGHNPGLHELALTLAKEGPEGSADRLAAGFPTAALASFRIGGSWRGLGPRTARLLRLITP